MPDPTKRLDWFPFFPKDWLDFRVLRMSLEAQGAYIRLLCHAWIDSPDQCSLPDNEQHIARVLSISKTKTKKILAEFFQNDDPIFFRKDGRYFSKRLAEEKHKGDKLREKRSLAGQKGARAKWDTPEPEELHRKNPDGIAIGLPMAKGGYLPVQVQRPKEDGTPPMEASPLFDFLYGLTKTAKMPNRPDRLRGWLEAWVERYGAAEVEAVLRSPEARGHDIIGIAKLLDSRCSQAETARGLVASALGKDPSK